MQSPSALQAVVTGATKGIGRAIAEKLLANGVRVIATGRSPVPSVPDGAEYEAVDFDDADAIEQFASKLAKIEPNILINNAGISLALSFEDTRTEDMLRLFQVNVIAPFRFSQAVLPAMRRNRWGRIVQVGSLAGMMAVPKRTAYCASKFALDGMTVALASEVAQHNVLVNIVAPGFVDTPLARSLRSPEELAENAKAIPMQRLAQPEELAAFVAWMASPENTYISGQNIAVDGGFHRV